MADKTALQNQVNTLAQQNQSLTDQNASLQGQVANLTGENQALIGGLTAGLGSVEQDLQRAFGDSQFWLPGATPLEKLQNLVTAVLNLEKGRKEGVYTNLGGKPGRKP